MSRVTRFGIFLMLFGILMGVTYLAIGIPFGNSERLGVFFLLILGFVFMVVCEE